MVPSKVKVAGEIQFSRVLRIEGFAQGKIIAPDGAGLIICHGGTFVGNLCGLGLVYVDGSLQGEICVNNLFLGPNAVVKGNIKCRQLSVSATASISGKMSVSPSLDIKDAHHEQQHLVADTPSAKNAPRDLFYDKDSQGIISPETNERAQRPSSLENDASN